MKWQIHQARARFSEMVRRALTEGPQTLTRYGKPVATLIPAGQHPRLRSRGTSFKAMLTAAPLQGVEITRARETTPKVDIERSGSDA
jgi:prevent-host-death family protein